MTRYVRMTMLAAALTAMTGGGAWAQVPAPSTPGPTTPAPTAPAPSAPAPAPNRDNTDMGRPATIGMMEGTVKKVDAATGTLRLSSGPFGLFSKSLRVGPDTQVTVDGRESSLSALREGTKVKASYEQRNGQTIATRIETMPQEQSGRPRS
ncbi:MAG TPA: hypothetical protein VFE48_08495 [Methylomirabilota bacterium]|nr:hypothetical protein [Methylomirabilota bacterium]